MANENELEKLNQELIATETNELKSVISSIHNDLANNTVPKLPEIVFKTYFADYFKNIKSFDPTSPLVLKWLEVANNVYTPVDLINEKAEVVERVPPLYAKPVLDEKIENKNFDNIQTTYANKTNYMATVGRNYLIGALSDLPELIKSDSEQHLKSWERVIDKYTDKPSKELELKPKEKEKVIKELPTDGLIYD